MARISALDLGPGILKRGKGERERERIGGGIFPDLFFTPGSRSQLSFLPDFPCLETFNPLTFYLGEELDNFSSRYIFRGYIYLSLSLSCVSRN